MKKILIADDETDFVMFLRRKLETRGYEVDETSRGSDVLNKLEEGVDLLLLDFSMPDMRGDEVCERIRKQEQYKKLPIIVITAHSSVDENAFHDMGVKNIIRKPLEDDELFEAIERLLGEK